MIPKIIHYCWFGGNEMSPLNLRCIESWKRHLPEWEIKRWDESNSPMNSDFVREAFKKKAWAHISDYVRVFALCQEGGVYFDTDMFLLKSFENLLEEDFFIGAIYSNHIGAGFVGSSKNHWVLRKLVKKYESMNFSYEVNTKFFDDIFSEKGTVNYKENVYVDDRTLILKPEIFYNYPKNAGYTNLPFDDYITENSIALHLWETSWLEEEFIDFWWGNYSKGFRKTLKRIQGNPFQSVFYYKKILWHFIRWLKK
ncbi:glycosyltransferase family 32 protein [Flammeovirga sp. OC4]|uniref:glycosyltransferase family 32 protein n=1 Tax=Flammeovirga sp. OC4 TaxID=1382345 RepID=UPI000694A770|nr:glycosyltransferase [Flammeovirga sp. OC4]